MQLDDLRLLLRVVDEGSVQRAAQAEGLSRTTLRRRLANLEASVGVPVLLRGPEGVRLTAAGEVVVRHGRSLLAQAETMVTQAQASEHEGDATIRLVVPVGASGRERLQFLRALEAAHPKVRLEVREVEDPIACADTPFELMLHYGSPPPRKGWFSRVLYRLPLSVWASPAYLERVGTPESLEDLTEHRIMMWRRPGQPVDAWPLCDGGSVPVDPWFITANLTLLRWACEQGEGLLLAPSPPFVGVGESEPLVSVLTDTIGEEETLRTLSPHPSTADSRVRAVLVNIQCVVERLLAK